MRVKSNAASRKTTHAAMRSCLTVANRAAPSVSRLVKNRRRLFVWIKSC
jgi:hypothetical protein